MQNPESRPRLLAQRIIIAVFKVLLPDVATRVEGIAEIAEVIGLGDQTQISTLSELLENNARHLASRMEQLEVEQASDLDEVDKWSAINAVLEAIATLSLTRADIIDMRLDAGAIYDRVEPSAEAIWVSLNLPDAAIDYGTNYLRESVAFIVMIVRQLPDLNTELMLSNLDLTHRLHQLINDAINRVAVARNPDEISIFESKYQSWVMTNNDSMEVFGLDVPAELSNQPIDVAYIALKASPLGDPSEQAGQFRWNTAAAASSSTNGSELSAQQYALRVDEALSQIAKSAASSLSPVAGQPSLGARILITGRAGSGKTTIGQWIAIKAVQHTFPDSLREWNACMPFVVRLRDAFSSRAPRDPGISHLVQLLSLREQLPAGWIEMRLRSKSLVILDGYDELSRVARGRFQKWVKTLDDDFPETNIIVTSRPEGLDGRWLSEMKFIQLELQPMTLADIKRCIEAWFRALIMISTTGREFHRKNQARLTSDIEHQDTLRELASTPLLCAMLCAFYAYNRSAAAPETRNQLYRDVVTTLVDARERGRNPHRSDLASLHFTQKLQLLQGLASYMTDTPMASIRCVPSLEESPEKEWPSDQNVTAREIIKARLTRMSLLPVTAEEALRILLDRSIVFRPIGYNQAHFAHRSIQEYLAGCDYADDGRFAELLQHLDDRQWWNIVAFAAGEFAIPQASLVVSQILDAAMRAEGEERRSLILLAAECYIAKGSFQAPVAERTRTLIEEVFPPTSLNEAEMVARGGKQMLPLLAERQDYALETRIACIRSAALIGEADALQVIAAYAESSNSTLELDELINSWQRFQPAEYARIVLSRASFGASLISLKTRPIVTAAAELRGIKKARIEAYESSFDFSDWSNGQSVEELDLAGNWRLERLEGVGNFSTLRKLNLTGARLLRSLDEVGDLTSLRELYLSGCAKLTDLSPITGLKRLRVLFLDDCSGITDFTPLRELGELMTLSINRCKLSSLAFCSGLRNIRRLNAMTREGIQDASAIAACDDLSKLELKMKSGAEGNFRLPSGSNLRRLVITGNVTADDLQSLGSHVQLQELVLSTVSGLSELSILADFDDLESVKIIDCGELSDVDALANVSGLREVDLSGSRIRNVGFVRGMPGLLKVELNRCSQLRNIEALLSLPALQYVSLLNSGVELKPAPDRVGEMSTSRTQVVVVHDPFVMVDNRLLTDEYLGDYDESAEVFGGEFYGPTG